MKNASVEDLVKIDDVGEIVARSVFDFFADEKNIKEIDDLINAGVKIKDEISLVKEGVFSGEKIVLTGTLIDFKRDDAAKIIESLGGEIMSGVSKKTTLVIAGESAGSKLDKARIFGIRVIDETEFKHLISNL